MKPTPHTAIARPRWWKGKISHRIACESGMMGPPPRPWKMRATISVVRLGAMPERNELATNSVEKMRQDDVGDAGVEDLHEGHHHDGEGDGPLLGRSDRWCFRERRRHADPAGVAIGYAS